MAALAENDRVPVKRRARPARGEERARDTLYKLVSSRERSLKGETSSKIARMDTTVKSNFFFAWHDRSKSGKLSDYTCVFGPFPIEVVS